MLRLFLFAVGYFIFQNIQAKVITGKKVTIRFGTTIHFDYE